MIGSSRLQALSQYHLSRKGEDVNIVAPLAFDDLPLEWDAKLGPYQMPDFQVAELANVSLCGPALVGIKAGDIVLDVGYYGRVDLWERNAAYFDMAMQAIRMPPIELDCAVSLVSCWSGNYFHWVLDELPKMEGVLWYACRRGIKPTLLIPQGISFAKASIARFYPQFDVIQVPCGIIHYRVNRLIVVTTRRHRGRMAPSALSYLGGLSANVHQAFTTPKIYIRRASPTRRVVNDDAVIEYLLGRGFTVLQNELMDFDEQVQRYAHATCVVGMHGAGLANIAWSNALRSVVEIVTPDYSNPCCWLVGQHISERYGIVMGAPAEQAEDVIVDIHKLGNVLDALEGR